MDSAYLKLYNYLRDAVHDPDSAKLDIEDLPEDMQDFGSGLKYFAQGVAEANAIAYALSAGVLNWELPSQDGNEIAAPLKSLRSSLRHLTWQAQCVAQGDYTQHIAFMREFATAFNTIVEQLAERERRLEKQSIEILRKSLALDQGNLLLTSLAHHIPQQIFIVDSATMDILHMNDVASYELKKDRDYLKRVVEHTLEQSTGEYGSGFNIKYKNADELERLLIVKKFIIDWNDSEADAYIVADMTATHDKSDDLLLQGYRDNLTNLYNRAYGMLTLDRWMHEKKRFVVIFVNLEGVRFVNEVFGQKEGDIYLINAAGYLKSVSDDAVVCRLGGDEFMILTLDLNFDEAHEKMLEISERLGNDEYRIGKQFDYDFSFGIAEVSERNMLPAGEILRIADERMYENKKHIWINSDARR